MYLSALVDRACGSLYSVPEEHGAQGAFNICDLRSSKLIRNHTYCGIPSSPCLSKTGPVLASIF